MIELATYAAIALYYLLRDILPEKKQGKKMLPAALLFAAGLAIRVALMLKK